MTLETVLDALNKGGVLAVLILILGTGWKGVWIFGSTHNQIVKDRDRELTQLRAERDRLLELALSATHQAGKAVDHLTTGQQRS